MLAAVPEQQTFKAEPIVRVVNWLKKYGTAILLVSCWGAWTIGKIIPLFGFAKPMLETAMLVVGLGAAMALLIEIKAAAIRSQSSVTIYPSMRAAQPLLVTLILKELASRHDSEIIISGTRMRTITGLLREVHDSLPKYGKGGRKLIRLIGMDPAYWAGLRLPGRLGDAEQAARNSDESRHAESALSDFEHQASWPERITFSVTKCDYLPSAYYFVIGRDDIVMGGVLWNEERSDIVGTSAPCWHLKRDSEEFETVAAWLANRANLMARTKTKAA